MLKITAKCPKVTFWEWYKKKYLELLKYLFTGIRCCFKIPVHKNIDKRNCCSTIQQLIWSGIPFEKTFGTGRQTDKVLHIYKDHEQIYIKCHSTWTGTENQLLLAFNKYSWSQCLHPLVKNIFSLGTTAVVTNKSCLTVMNSSSVYSSPSQGKYEYLITSFTSDSIGLL